jgi:hypothetical protein
MPRTLIRAPQHDRTLSLGWLCISWMEHFVRHGPGSVQGRPISHGDEYTGVVVDAYAVGEHPSNNHLLYDSVFFSRPKGCDKSGLGARLALFEALGPARFIGWAIGGEVYEDPWGLGFRYVYEAGEPMGGHVTAPFVRIMSTEESQVGNVYETIYYNLTDEECPLAHVPGVDAGRERVYLPWGGEIRTSTASSSSKDGGKETFVVFDESHLYNTPELRRMYLTVAQNTRKRKKFDGTWFIETTTMFAPGEESIAEKTFAEAEALADGRKTRGRHRLLYDHRWGEVDDLADELLLRAGLLEAYGEAAAWMDIDGLVDQFYDSRNPVANSRRFFLNAQTAANDAWIAPHEWNACRRPERAIKPGDMVTLGLDGSVNDDSTAVVACRVSDGHLQLVGVWERPEGLAGEGWQVDREAVDACVAGAMATYEVVGFFADPAHWQDYLDRWHGEYAARMKVKATDRRPLEWWTNRPKAMVSALERFYEAVVEQRLSFTPPEDRTGRDAELAATLSRHVRNARRMPTRSGLQIRKEFPHSKRKIDACMSAVLAFESRMEAVAAGVKSKEETFYAARRIR